MHSRFAGNDWYKVLWRLVTTPAVEVIVAIVVVLLSAWIVVQTEAEHRGTLFPLFLGHR